MFHHRKSAFARNISTSRAAYMLLRTSWSEPAEQLAGVPRPEYLRPAIKSLTQLRRK